MKTLHEFLENSAKIFPDKEVLVCGEEKLTYFELNERSEKVRSFLTEKCQKQEAVSILLENSVNFLVAYFGILKSGCIAHIIPVNTSGENFKTQIEEVNPRLIITVGKYLARLERNEINLPVIDIDEPLTTTEQPRREVFPEDISTIIYSSGTTSRPKGVKLLHHNVVSATENMIEYLGVKESDTYLNVLPLSHSFGLGNVHMHIRQGGRIIIERNSINIPEFLKKIIDEKATVFAAAPATYRLILDTNKELFAECNKTLKIMITNSTYIPPETTREVLQSLPDVQFYTYYGLTEASRSTFNHFNNLQKLKSVGKAAPNVEIRIVNEQGKELLANEVGEICITGNHVIKEYWKNEHASKSIIEDWIHTGDSGYLDEEGFLFLVGRKDDMINIGGEKVSPLEIESIAGKIKGVEDCVAIPADDRILTQVVHLFVVKANDAVINEQDIISELKNNLEGYKIPKKVEFINEIPKTDTGKKKRSLFKS